MECFKNKLKSTKSHMNLLLYHTFIYTQTEDGTSDTIAKFSPVAITKILEYNH